MGVTPASLVRNGGSKRKRRRSRRVQEQRRRLFTAGALTLAALLAMPLTVAGLTGEEISLPGAQTARTFLAMMNDRSPGERTSGELTKTKAAVASVPRQRALGKVREPELPKTFTDAIVPPPPIAAPGPLFAESVPLVALTTPPPGGGVFLTPPGGGGGGGGGGPPGTPPEQPPEQPPEEPPTVPPVPEPSTWAMMLLGFAMSGWMIRRRRVTAFPIQAV